MCVSHNYIVKSLSCLNSFAFKNALLKSKKNKPNIIKNKTVISNEDVNTPAILNPEYPSVGIRL